MSKAQELFEKHKSVIQCAAYWKVYAPEPESSELGIRCPNGETCRELCKIIKQNYYVVDTECLQLSERFVCYFGYQR